MNQPAYRRLAYEATHATSNRVLREAMTGEFLGFGHALSGLRQSGIVSDDMTVQAAIASITRWMLQHYRSEGLYKNAIANELFLRRHRDRQATLLTEVAVGRSIADCVIVNGRGTVYEVKTELDNPDKLRRQFDDYYRAFSAVYLVTHEKAAARYMNVLTEFPAGLIVLDDTGRLRTRSEAVCSHDRLSIPVMMKTLRKPEYTRVAESIHGGPLQTRPTDHFAQCMSIAESISPVEFASLYEGQLRTRRARQVALIRARPFRNVRHQLLKLDPTEVELRRVSAWMAGGI